MFIKYIMNGGYKYKYRSPRSIGRQLYNRHHKKSKTKSAKKSKSIFDLYKSPNVKTRRRKVRRKRRKQTRQRRKN